MADETPGPAPDPGPEPGTTWATEAMLKAYAHPLRRRIARALARQGHARAADLAAHLDVPANSVSFHLRVLADAGMIEEAPEHARDRRDRVWKAMKRSWSIGSPEHPIEDEALGTALMASLTEEHLAMVRRVLTWSAEYVAGRDTATHGAFSQANLRLTEEEFLEMQRRIGEVITEITDAHDPDDPDTRLWTLDIVAADDTI